MNQVGASASRSEGTSKADTLTLLVAGSGSASADPARRENDHGAAGRCRAVLYRVPVDSSDQLLYSVRWPEGAIMASIVSENTETRLWRDETKIHSEPVSELGAGSTAILDRIRETKRPVALRHEGRAIAVVVDIESYQSLLDEVDLLRDVQLGLADVEAGRVIAHEEVRELLHKRYPG